MKTCPEVTLCGFKDVNNNNNENLYGANPVKNSAMCCTVIHYNLTENEKEKKRKNKQTKNKTQMQSILTPNIISQSIRHINSTESDPIITPYKINKMIKAQTALGKDKNKA